MKKIGSKIAEARKRKGLTQEELGGLMDLSFQAVSSWERGETVPDLKNLIRLREILGVSLDSLTSETDSGWELNNPNYNEDHMYTYLKAKAQEISLPQTLAALPFMKEKHAGYFRDGSFNTPYSAHPLTTASGKLSVWYHIIPTTARKRKSKTCITGISGQIRWLRWSSVSTAAIICP